MPVALPIVSARSAWVAQAAPGLHKRPKAVGGDG